MFAGEADSECKPLRPQLASYTKSVSWIGKKGVFDESRRLGDYQNLPKLMVVLCLHAQVHEGV